MIKHKPKSGPPKSAFLNEEDLAENVKQFSENMHGRKLLNPLE